MEKKDLMIGDWVQYTQNYYTEEKGVWSEVHYGRVCSVGLLYVKVDRGSIAIEPEIIQPISLTAEILEKNGWKLISNTRYKLEYSWGTGAIEEYADIHICVGKDHSNVWRWDFPILNIHLYRGDMELTKFRYVHELQHALRLCGIEKEIEL